MANLDPSTNTSAKLQIDGHSFPGAFELLKPSWQAVRLNFITIVEFLVIPVILSLLATVMFRGQADSGTAAHVTFGPAYFVTNGISTLVSLLFAPGIAYTMLQGAKGKQIDFAPALRRGLHYFWRYVGVVICSGFIILVGLALLIVPGLFMLRRYYLAPYYLIDRDLSVFETLRVCSAESKRFSGAVWGVIGVQVLFAALLIIPILGWIAGTILTVMYYNAPALRYSQIKAATGVQSERGTAAPTVS